MASLLESKGVSVFLPTYLRRDLRAGRGVRLKAPLFPGYLFCRIDLSDRLPVLETKWVNAIVSRGRVPIAIPESELTSLRKIIAHGVDAQPEELAVGQPVRLVDGPLAGVAGVITRTRDRYRIVVGITLLQRAVSAEVDRRAVLPVSMAG